MGYTVCYLSLGKLYIFLGEGTMKDAHISVMHLVWQLGDHCHTQKNENQHKKQKTVNIETVGKRVGTEQKEKVQPGKEETQSFLKGQSWDKPCSMFGGLRLAQKKVRLQ